MGNGKANPGGQQKQNRKRGENSLEKPKTNKENGLRKEKQIDLQKKAGGISEGNMESQKAEQKIEGRQILTMKKASEH